MNRFNTFIFFILIFLGGCAAYDTSKNMQTRLLQQQSPLLQQGKTLEGEELIVQLIPYGAMYLNIQNIESVKVDSNNENAVCFKVVYIMAKEKLAARKSMHIDYGMQDSFLPKLGADELQSEICERIPLANENELTYLVTFKKNKMWQEPAEDWIFTFSDSILGVSPTNFIFKKELINQFIKTTK